MADQATRRKPPTKEKRPSRLRHEIRPESTDGKKDDKGGTAQEPHNDMIMLGTQLDGNRNVDRHMQNKDPRSDFTEAPLSPNSQLTLERFKAPKKTIVSESDPILFKPLTKELSETGGGPALPFQPFSYERVIRTISETNTKRNSTELLPIASATSPSSTNEERSEQISHGELNTRLLHV